MPPAPIRAFAPAKINLALHVTGQRADGYHFIESLVVFAKVGDWLTIEFAQEDALTFSGIFGGDLQADPATNLVLKARDVMRKAGSAKAVPCPPVHIHLEKNLPLSSGIGGGSADAAATMRVLNSLWSLGLSEAELLALGLPLGADVPMCICGKPLLATGIGEILTPVLDIPPLSLVLVNPNVSVSTPQIFKALVNMVNPPMPESPLLQNVSGVITYLSTTRNDLEPPALTLCPAIGDVLKTLAESGARLARMSGSGATCFGIYDSDEAAKIAAETIVKQHPNWWVA